MANSQILQAQKKNGVPGTFEDFLAALAGVFNQELEQSKAQGRCALLDEFMHCTRPGDDHTFKKIVLRESPDICTRRADQDGATVVSYLLDHLHHWWIERIQMDLVCCALTNPINRRTGQKYRQVQI